MYTYKATSIDRLADGRLLLIFGFLLKFVPFFRTNVKHSSSSERWRERDRSRAANDVDVGTQEKRINKNQIAIKLSCKTSRSDREIYKSETRILIIRFFLE